MKHLFLSLAILALSACHGSGSPYTPTTAPDTTAVSAYRNAPGSEVPSGPSSSMIDHVVIIIQENRTVDNLFNGFPGADTVRSGLNSQGQQVPFKERPLNWGADIAHSHGTFVTEYDSGKLDGFDQAGTTSKSCNNHGDCPYAYVPQSEVQPYFDMGEQYVFGDRMFQGNQGPSFPAHQELISANASIDSNPADPQVSGNPIGTGIHGSGGGCDSAPGTLVNTIPLEPIGAPEGNPIFPCFDRPTLATLLDQAGISWRYYQKSPGKGLWHAFDAIKAVHDGPEINTNVIYPSETILTDIQNGNLASVSWVTPDGDHSDHSGNVNDTGGPSWVTAIVNAIGQSQYWNHTAIIVTWDDWGGWYDHVPPPIRDNYELGFRVPLLVISPYAKAGYVSHSQHEFGSILHFTEDVFGLPSLGGSDAIADDLSDCFDFTQAPRTFQPISAPPFVPGKGPSSLQEDP